MKDSPSLWKRSCFGKGTDKMMKGLSGEAGPRKGADQTIAGLIWRTPKRIICGLQVFGPADRNGAERRSVGATTG